MTHREYLFQKGPSRNAALVLASAKHGEIQDKGSHGGEAGDLGDAVKTLVIGGCLGGFLFETPG